VWLLLSVLSRTRTLAGLYSSGVNTVTGLPNEHPLVAIPLKPESPTDGSPWPPGAEQHGPYQHGGIFPAVNGGGGMIAHPPIVVGVQPGHATGPSEPGYMKTETGCSSLSSFESMAGTLAPSEYSIHSDPFHERNYPGDPIILSYFGASRNLSESGVVPLQTQTYLNMLGAGLQRKANIESWRSTNIWAMLMWQLNEIWPTGGWGSIEYGTPVKGQVVGGRWKPLHHMMAQSAYTDVTAACGVAKVTTMDASDQATGPALCYIRNDLPTPFTGTVTVEALQLSSGKSVLLNTLDAKLPAGGGSLGFFCAMAGEGSPISPTASAPSCSDFSALFNASGCSRLGGADCVLRVLVKDQGDTSNRGAATVSNNVLPLVKPSELQLPHATVSHTVSSAAAGSHSVGLSLKSTATALFVWLSTAEHGRFSDNAFLLLPGEEKQISFESFLEAGTSSTALSSSLRVEHLGMYL
jgi:beta-mannosidase